jgi:hypothetical protein
MPCSIRKAIWKGSKSGGRGHSHLNDKLDRNPFDMIRTGDYVRVHSDQGSVQVKEG